MESVKLMLEGSLFVAVNDQSAVNEKMAKLVSGGPDKLQLIVDFDNTISKSDKLGKPMDTSWTVLERFSKLPISYREKVLAIKNKYYPIEIDPKLTVEEKTPFMAQWYREANLLLAESEARKNWFPEMVQQSNCELRDDTDVFLKRIHEAQVPFIILSAGVGDIIEHVLMHSNLLYDNMKIVSNFLEFDDNGKAVGLKTEPIHVFNKKAVDQEGLEERKNIILIGDSLGDLDMADGIKDINVILKIGFLNKNQAPNLNLFKEKFDVVLLDDQTMQFPIAVINDIIKPS